MVVGVCSGPCGNILGPDDLMHLKNASSRDVVGLCAGPNGRVVSSERVDMAPIIAEQSAPTHALKSKTRCKKPRK